MAQHVPARLRRLRKEVHDHLDPLWADENPVGNRVQAYTHLARLMGIQLKDCHAALFNEDQCRRSIELMPQVREALEHDRAEERAFAKLSKAEIQVLKLAHKSEGFIVPDQPPRRDLMKQHRKAMRALRKLFNKGFVYEHPRNPDQYFASARGRHCIAWLHQTDTKRFTGHGTIHDPDAHALSML